MQEACCFTEHLEYTGSGKKQNQLKSKSVRKRDRLERSLKVRVENRNGQNQSGDRGYRRETEGSLYTD